MADLLEECPDRVKRFKNPTVNFGKLQGLCSTRVREHVSLQGGQA